MHPICWLLSRRYLNCENTGYYEPTGKFNVLLFVAEDIDRHYILLYKCTISKTGMLIKRVEYD